MQGEVDPTDEIKLVDVVADMCGQIDAARGLPDSPPRGVWQA